jgi:hypothetical protein
MSKWSDDGFLDTLRGLGDETADACALELVGRGNLAGLFRHADSNTESATTDAPAPIASFFERTRALPPGVDLQRVARGESLFETHAFPMALVLLARSLPEGYAAPNLARVLSLSGDLDHHPYRRLMGVLQMVVNVTTVRGFEDGGKAVVTAQKLRLLHAGIRHIARSSAQMSDFEARYGVPVNLEDMLGTIMGLSYLVIDGLPKVEVRLTRTEAEDMYYLWTVFARMMGIHPPGKPDSDDFVPRNLTEATEFYAAYARRHYVNAARNPQGVELARQNLRMLEDLVPPALRAVGLGVVPRIYMYELIGAEGCQRVGVRPFAGHGLLRTLCLDVCGALMRVLSQDNDSKNPHDHWSRALFQHMIDKQYGGEVTFLYPTDLEDLRKLA